MLPEDIHILIFGDMVSGQVQVFVVVYKNI